jgi:hypothetical protein
MKASCDTETWKKVWTIHFPRTVGSQLCGKRQPSTLLAPARRRSSVVDLLRVQKCEARGIEDSCCVVDSHVIGREPKPKL